MRSSLAPTLLLLSVASLACTTTSSRTSGKGMTPDRWETWSSRPTLQPVTEFRESSWRIESAGSASCHGGWDLHWDRIQPGKSYRIEVSCQVFDVPAIHDSVLAELSWWTPQEKRADWARVRFERRGADLFDFAWEGQAPSESTRATLRLALRWTTAGKVSWRNPGVVEIDAPPARRVKAALATGKFPGTGVEENLQFAIQLINRAADAGAEVVCLPECITSWGCEDLEKEGARPIPGPETDALCEIARRRDIDVVCSMNELNGKLIHNTGLYIDAKRGIVGKYRKVHLSVGERRAGVIPGKEFPVWGTQYGKAGMLICYDNVHPEGHRILAQKGAEVLFLPIMGDPRAVGEEAYLNWRRIMQVRAMDNHVWFIVCHNDGQWGLIVRPDGKIVAEVDPSTGLAMAELDLRFRFDSWIGSDFENRYWGERRPHLYGELVEDR